MLCENYNFQCVEPDESDVRRAVSQQFVLFRVHDGVEEAFFQRGGYPHDRREGISLLQE